MLKLKKISQKQLITFFAILLFFIGASTFAQTPSIVGNYNVVGTNPTGRNYTGNATISQKGNVYVLGSIDGGQGYAGVGILNGNILSVGWRGYNRPVGVTVYTINPDGTIKGYWTAKGESTLGVETLTPMR